MREQAYADYLAGKSPQLLFEELGVTNPETAGSKLRARRRKLAAPDAPGLDIMGRNVIGVLDSEIDGALLRLLRQRKLWPLADLCNAVDQSPKRVRAAIDRLQQAGRPINLEEREVSLPEVPPPLETELPAIWTRPAGRIVTAHISDTQFGSMAVQKTALDLFMQIAWEEYGVDVTFHSGDWCTGVNMFKGQHYETYAQGFEAQLEDTVVSMPRRAGHTYYGIGGNHDFSFYKAARIDFMAMLAKERPDIINCGWDTADVPLTEACDVRLWHPSGGVPYAISYRGQKYSAQIAFEELLEVTMGGRPAPRVRLLQIGHLHVMAGPTIQGALRFFQAGCFEAQTSYLKRKGLVPMIGAYIMEHEITDNGIIRRQTMTDFIFDPVDDDYRRHRRPDPSMNVRRVEAICTFGELDAAPEYRKVNP